MKEIKKGKEGDVKETPALTAGGVHPGPSGGKPPTLSGASRGLRDRSYEPRRRSLRRDGGHATSSGWFGRLGNLAATMDASFTDSPTNRSGRGQCEHP